MDLGSIVDFLFWS